MNKRYNDNRNYKYKSLSTTNRIEFSTIFDWVSDRSCVVDLGCGDGTLLGLLRERGIKGEGIDISESGVEAAKKKGLVVRRGRIDVTLPYGGNQFDFAICNATVQMVMYPEVLIKEMKRIGKKQVISFPNFAFILNRLDLLLSGRMPRYMIPGYKWYSTGHIHQLSVRDFKSFCRDNNIKILREKYIFSRLFFWIPRFFQLMFPNLFAASGLFLTTSEEIR